MNSTAASNQKYQTTANLFNLGTCMAPTATVSEHLTSLVYFSLTPPPLGREVLLSHLTDGKLKKRETKDLSTLPLKSI